MGGAVDPSQPSKAILELKAGRELHLPRVGGTVRKWAIADGSILVEVAAWVGKVDVVEGVEPVSPKLEGDSLFDQEVLLHRDVGVEEVRTEGLVAASGSDLVESRNSERTIGSGERVGVVILEAVSREAGYLRMESSRITVDVAGGPTG